MCPFKTEGHAVARLASPVVEIRQRLILGEDDGIDAAVVIEIAGGETAADARHPPRGAGPAEMSTNRPSGRFS